MSSHLPQVRPGGDANGKQSSKQGIRGVTVRGRCHISAAWAGGMLRTQAVPGMLRASCWTLLGEGEALHGQLRVPGAAQPPLERQPVLRTCGISEG